MIKKWAFLKTCEKGAVAIEFALIAPLMILFVIGVIEIATAMAVSTMLEGGLREASRFGVTGSTTGGRQASINQILANHSYGLINPANISLSTKVYGSFASIGDEEYTDSNNNGTHDNGEPYTDRNGNGQWDADGGSAGLGSSSQIVVYRVNYDWPYLTGIFRPIVGNSLHLSSAIAVRNEPY
ncbi:MAG: pilus assembly protein [Alphaproteobacteria bacterium]|nr:MAG: pilus assembly protein [Alphaproteobacteria bacterium]